MSREIFFTTVLRSDGRLSPKTIKESYFISKGLHQVWLDFISNTNQLSHLSMKERIWCYQQHISVLPKCKCCDNDVMILTYKKGKELSRYCSASCALHDSDTKKISASNRDHVKANQVRCSTMWSKYGVEYNSQRLDIKEKLSKPKVSDRVLQWLNNVEWLTEQYITLNKTSTEIGDMVGCDFSTVLSYIRKHDIDVKYRINSSSHERKIHQLLQSLGVAHISNDRSIGKEIDVYIPSKHFGIEVNGSYWHSYSSLETKDQINRHQNKFNLCRQNDITLYQFTDIDLNEKYDLVVSMIKNKLGLSTKINARQCTIDMIDNRTYKDFCNDNHISGYAKANIRIGLFLNSKLVSILSLHKSRYSNIAEWEIIRFCTIRNHSVRGGFTKLFKYFLINYNPLSICTYSDNRFGDGGVYSSNGFVYQYTTKPGYAWTDTKSMLSRYQCQKSKLPLLLGDKFDSGLSESANMFNNKYRRIWDAGHKLFTYIP